MGVTQGHVSAKDGLVGIGYSFLEFIRISNRHLLEILCLSCVYKKS